MVKIKKTLIEYLLSEADFLIEHIKNRKIREREQLGLEIDKCINFYENINKHTVLHSDLYSKELRNHLIENIITLYYEKEKKYRIKKYNNSYAYTINGKKHKDYTILYDKKVNFKKHYNLNYYFKNITVTDVIALLRKILLLVGIDNKEVNDLLRRKYNYNNQKSEKLLYSIILIEDNILSLPLKELEILDDFGIFITNKLEDKIKFNPNNISKVYNNFKFNDIALLYINEKHNISNPFSYNRESIFQNIFKSYYDKLSHFS